LLVIEAENTVSQFLHESINLDIGNLGVDAPYFEAGLSIAILKARHQFEIEFGITEKIP
jgi:hypothetical protein